MSANYYGQSQPARKNTAGVPNGQASPYYIEPLPGTEPPVDGDGGGTGGAGGGGTGGGGGVGGGGAGGPGPGNGGPPGGGTSGPGNANGPIRLGDGDVKDPKTNSGGGGGGGGTDGLVDDYASPTGGLVGYYGRMMGSTGMSEAEYNALNQSTTLPIQQQQRQAQDEMLRVRAATGNDAGIYGGLSEVTKNAGAQIADQGRKNVLANADIKRQEQAAGAAGNLNLYGQNQTQSMEYLRMLANVLGRTSSTSGSGSSSGVTAGIAWNPGGTA